MDGYGLIFGLIVRENEDVFSTDGEVSRSQIPFCPAKLFQTGFLQVRHLPSTRGRRKEKKERIRRVVGDVVVVGFDLSDRVGSSLRY